MDEAGADSEFPSWINELNESGELITLLVSLLLQHSRENNG